MRNTIQRGQSEPVGATVKLGGVIFCLSSRHALGVELMLFQQENGIETVLEAMKIW